MLANGTLGFATGTVVNVDGGLNVSRIEADTEVSLFVRDRATGRLVFNSRAIEALGLSPAELAQRGYPLDREIHSLAIMPDDQPLDGCRPGAQESLGSDKFHANAITTRLKPVGIVHSFVGSSRSNRILMAAFAWNHPWRIAVAGGDSPGR
jgi:hypothetical protein